MSSFMRTVERQKLRTQIENNEGRHNVSKKLKVWFDAYRQKKHEYLMKKKMREANNGR